jgi:hypothetical protein
MSMTDKHQRRPEHRHDHERSEPMYAASTLRLRLAHDRRQGDLKAAATARLLRAHRATEPIPIRTRIGRSIIRLGERLASEPSLEPARPR